MTALNSGSFSPPISNSSTGQQFAKDGYYLAKSIFSPSELETLEADFDCIVKQISSSGEDINATWSGPEMARLGAADKVVLHTHNVQQYSAVWLAAFMQSKFLNVARDILGNDIILHHSKLFQKPPEKGAPFPMHQDWTYFPTEQNSMIAAIIHVSKATDEMGCIRVGPGSHKMGRIEGSSGQSSQLNEYLAAHPLEEATSCPAEPGDVLFFHYFTLHGSMPNRSQDVRKTVLIQMYQGNDKVEEGNQHPNERLVLSGFNGTATRSTVNVH